MGKPSKNGKTAQDRMDRTLEDTFPASDPPSWSSPHFERQQERGGNGQPDEDHKDRFSREDYTRGHKRNEKFAPSSGGRHGHA